MRFRLVGSVRRRDGILWVRFGERLGLRKQRIEQWWQLRIERIRRQRLR
jgi:hypothetical protein